jgi:hypothetical protein
LQSTKKPRRGWAPASISERVTRFPTGSTSSQRASLFRKSSSIPPSQSVPVRGIRSEIFCEVMKRSLGLIRRQRVRRLGSWGCFTVAFWRSGIRTRTLRRSSGTRRCGSFERLRDDEKYVGGYDSVLHGYAIECESIDVIASIRAPCHSDDAFPERVAVYQAFQYSSRIVVLRFLLQQSQCCFTFSSFK